MMNLLSAGNFFETFWERFTLLLQTYNFWVGIFLAVLGVTLFLLAKRLTRLHRGVDEIVNNDRVLITYKVLSIACVVSAVIIWIFFC